MVMVQRDELTYVAQATGYMVYYLNQPIGGAGILGKYKGRGKARRQQIHEYGESAKRDIDSLLIGRGPVFMISAIQKIQSS